MSDTELDVLSPPNADWVPLTGALLASSAVDEWEEMAERFEPVQHEAGERMADWFRQGIRSRRMPAETHAIRAGDDLLGFFAVEHVTMEFSRRAWPILEIRRRDLRERVRRLAREPQPGLMLSAITRSCDTQAGFGAVLLDQAIGIALQQPEIVALFVRPANPQVGSMWERRYHFRPMDDPKLTSLLYLPVDPTPEASWP